MSDQYSFGGGSQLPPWLQQQQAQNNPWQDKIKNMLQALTGGGASPAQVVNPQTGTAGTNISPQMLQQAMQASANPLNQPMGASPAAPPVSPPGAPPPPPPGAPATPTLAPTLGGNNTPMPSSMDAGAGLFSPAPLAGSAFGGV